MTRLARRTSLLVALSLLATAATGCAKCAWVLWGRHSDRSWEPITTFRTQKECKDDLEVARQHLIGTGLVCLPDTVDPREPRAK